MRTLLPRGIFDLLRRIGNLANANGYSAFVVGGLVRDLVMGRRNIDLDIVIEGDAIAFAGILAERLNGTLLAHKRFGTASLFLRRGLKIDLATARKEIYRAPAALPTVIEFGSLKDDLIRRDFTINAMAVSLNKGSFGRLVDFFGGVRDLKKGEIKVLHDSSFIDDPTRIFRAVRFEQRFGFKIDEHAEELIKDAANEEMFEKTEKQRIREELMLMLKEPHPLKAIRRMDELHELTFIDKKIIFSVALEKFFASIEKALKRHVHLRLPPEDRAIDVWLIYMMALVDNLSYNGLRGFCGRFVFTKKDRLSLLSFKEASRKAVKTISRNDKVSPSRIYSMLKPLAREVILAIAAKSGSRLANARAMEFFRRYHDIRLRINGKDLKSLGLKPGPEFKNILEKALYKKIDGRLKTKADEIRYAERLIALSKRRQQACLQVLSREI